MEKKTGVKPMKFSINKMASTAFLASFLVACGGGGSNDSSQTTKDLAGTLVVAESTETTAEKTLIKARGVQGRSDCPSVPNGYLPLELATVEFLDETGAVLDTTTTDTCGEFTANAPLNTVMVKTATPDNKDLIVEVAVFEVAGSGLASTISDVAEYQIASMQATGDSLVFTITDTVTNKAVIGIPDTAFIVTVNSQSADVSDVVSAANTAEPASVTLVLDASGSMNGSVYDDSGDPVRDANGVWYTRMRLTALASHTYLDNMPGTDESAFVVFDSDVNLINDAEIATLFQLQDSNAVEAGYSFSESGYTSSPADLRFVVDSYNHYSSLYSDQAEDQKHADTPDLRVARFPWGGATAMYDAIDTALDNTSLRNNVRKIVIAMSDGSDNSSSSSEASVISKAQDSGIPVYTIAYEDADAETMETIASETNATSFLVDGPDLAGVFQSIQTGITFQYIANLSNSLNSADVVTLTMNYNGLEVSRQITR